MRVLNKLTLSEKLLHTGFIIMVCIGLLAAEAYLYVTHTGLDGKAGVMLWRLPTQPQQTATVRHYYSVRYPADRVLSQREANQ